MHVFLADFSEELSPASNSAAEKDERLRRCSKLTDNQVYYHQQPDRRDARLDRRSRATAGSRRVRVSAVETWSRSLRKPLRALRSSNDVQCASLMLVRSLGHCVSPFFSLRARMPVSRPCSAAGGGAACPLDAAWCQLSGLCIVSTYISTANASSLSIAFNLSSSSSACVSIRSPAASSSLARHEQLVRNHQNHHGCVHNGATAGKLRDSARNLRRGCTLALCRLGAGRSSWLAASLVQKS